MAAGRAWRWMAAPALARWSMARAATWPGGGSTSQHHKRYVDSGNLCFSHNLCTTPTTRCCQNLPTKLSTNLPTNLSTLLPTPLQTLHHCAGGFCDGQHQRRRRPRGGVCWQQQQPRDQGGPVQSWGPGHRYHWGLVQRDWGRAVWSGGPVCVDQQRCQPQPL